MPACRICRDTAGSNMVLLEENNGFLSLFEYCFGLSVTTQDLPRHLCVECAEKVQTFSRLKEQCIKSDEFWKTQNNVQTVARYQDKMTESDIGAQKDGRNDTQDEAQDVLQDEAKDNATKDAQNGSKCSDYSTEETLEISYYCHEDPAEPVQIEIPTLTVNTSEKTVSTMTDMQTSDTRSNKKFRQFKCRKCKKKYGKQRWYQLHIETCYRKKSYMNFKQRDNLNSSKHTTQLTRKTSNVKAEMKSNQKISKGTINKIHLKRDDIYYCGLCDSTFTSDNAISEHLDNHWKRNELDCKLCEFVAVDLAALIVHRFTHYPAKLSPRYNCHMCDKSKRTSRALQFHYRSEHLKRIGGLCSLCNKEFKGLHSWKKHELRHKKTRDFICDICGRRFFYKYQIREHVMDHLDLNKYVCHECGKIFTRTKYLKIHMDGVHAKTGSVKCYHCNRIFKSSKTLRVHLSTVSRPKTIKCQYCPKEFSSACFLKSHMVMHSDARPYSCHICGVSYKAKSLLKLHIVTKHTGLRPHKCDLCSKSFGRLEQLRRHVSVHTGLRAHKCMQCDRSFHEKKLLQKHYELRHKMVDANENE
ncbi:unnamed protein product [Chrysodeixis includens]|uniref:Uncharacterized protein n=1 Tax=Chrysodeixis includens TaxID=689277 RepID=A0A9P0BQC7_CHRIL|nr:unnamed protein product [Chrysodeixis includens]